jgi:hypothetical protein
VSYDVTVYVRNPIAAWEGRGVCVTFHARAAWLWLARWVAMGQLGNTGNCGYLIRRDGEDIEHVEPPTPEAVDL